MRRIAAFALAAVMTGSVAACGGADQPQAGSTAAATSAAQTHSVTDMAGNTVQVPNTIERIADSWPAHTGVVMLLGAGDKLVATANTAKGLPWMFKIQPSLNDAVTTNSQDFSTEMLAAKNPDVLFMSPGNVNADKIQGMGIPTVQLNFTNYDEMKKCITLTAQVLGGDAPQRAQQYNSYLDQTIAAVSAKTGSVPAAQRPKVLHIQSLEPLKVDGANTIIDDWITAAGGVNAAQGVTGNMKEVSMEQVIGWNPDIVIVGKTDSGGAASLTANPQWSVVKAVQSKKVVDNPVGVFGWDRYSPEQVLQLQWAAKTFHPELFADTDVVKATQDYYKTYLGYDLTADEAQRILTAQPPAG